ncbi:MAG TPA: hypothetical protein VLB00_04280 [Gemmatimonadales bacterium]|nr:hypothetical protein [Gemmatimonadales bacterium]
MNRIAVLGALAVIGCGGSQRTAPPPSPLPGAPAPSVAEPSSARIQYRIRSPLRYEISRYDSLFFLGTGSTPQITGRRAMVTVRQDGSRLQVTLDSVAGVLGPRLAQSAIDSTRGTRWESRASASGPSEAYRSSKNTVLVGQVGAAVALLYPQLPEDGVRVGEAWDDSTATPIRLDAFESLETRARNSRAVAGAAPKSVRIEVVESLTRTGKAIQGGREMGLVGSGVRRVLYDLAAEGWITMVQAQDSLDLRVTVPDSPDPIPVRWRSTVIARLRGLPPA